MKRPDRGGNILLLVAFFGLLISGAFISVTYLTKTDLSTNENLLREILATNLAESIAAQIETQVNTRPWSRRFWLLAAQAAGTVDPGSGVVPRALLDEKSPQIDLSQDTLAPDRYTILGLVKDLPASLREYRLYLEVTLDGEVYAFSWDKRWELSLIAGLDRDNTQQDRIVEDPVGAGPVDDMLDSLKIQAVTAVTPEGSGEDQMRILIGLRNHEPYFKATAVPGGPQGAPRLSLRDVGNQIPGSGWSGSGMDPLAAGTWSPAVAEAEDLDPADPPGVEPVSREDEPGDIPPEESVASPEGAMESPDPAPTPAPPPSGTGTTP